MTSLFDRFFAADLRLMASLRSDLRDGLGQAGVPDAMLERLILVVDEVVSNSIEHGAEYRRSDLPIRVMVRKEEAGLQLVIDDIDVPRATMASLLAGYESSDTPPGLLLERGRGLFLINTFLEDLKILRVEGGGMRLQGMLQESRF